MKNEQAGAGVTQSKVEPRRALLAGRVPDRASSEGMHATIPPLPCSPARCQNDDLRSPSPLVQTILSPPYATIRRSPKSGSTWKWAVRQEDSPALAPPTYRATIPTNKRRRRRRREEGLADASCRRGPRPSRDGGAARGWKMRVSEGLIREKGEKEKMKNEQAGAGVT
jgi:hypothetical protein